MRRSGDIPWGEYRLGLLVVVGLAIFIWASIRGGAAFLENRVPLSARFRDVGGLAAGSPVWFRGVEVGSVRDLAIVPAGDSSVVQVRMEVRRATLKSLTSDSKARIAAINFFGEKFVDLVPGSARPGTLAPGQVLENEEAVEFSTMMEEGKGAISSVDKLSQDLDLVVTKIRDARGSLGLMINERGLYDDLRRVSRETADLARDMNESQKRTSKALIGMAEQLDSLTARVNRGEGSLGLLARDPRLYTALAGASAGADSAFGRLNAGEGSAGRLMTDQRAYDELTKSLARLNALLADIQKNPKRYLRISLF